MPFFFIVDLTSAVLLFISAVFWIRAAKAKMPVLNGVLADVGEPLRELSASLVRQSKINWLGALCAAGGVLAQALVTVLRLAL